jgi:hypothetical protein
MMPAADLLARSDPAGGLLEGRGQRAQNDSWIMVHEGRDLIASGVCLQKRDRAMEQAQAKNRTRTGRALLLMISGVIVFATTFPALGGEVKKEYPRLGGIQIGTTPYNGYGDPAYRKAMARLDLVLLGGSGKIMNDHARAIKDLNPDILLAKYTNVTAVLDKENDYNTPLIRKLSSEQGPNNTNASDWWLRDFEGERVTGATKGNVRTNITEWVKPDSQGRRWPEFKAEHDYNQWFKDTVWDIWYSDVSNWRPKFQNRGFIGDFSGGKIEDQAEVEAGWRRGHRSWWRAIRRLRPGIMIMANHNWYLYQDKNNGVWDIKEYDKQVEGGLLERIMGWDNSFEANKGWHRLYDAYRWSDEYLRGTPVLFFNVIGKVDDYQFFRYAFATCLMGNGFFDYSPEKFHYGTVEWFDEFDRDGKDTTSWMGLPAAGSAWPDTAWQKGVYRRDFENAVVLVNPRGNGVKTVDVEEGLRRLSGRQDPAVNNGKVAGRIQLADGDGIVLVREDYLLRPDTPGIEVSK